MNLPLTKPGRLWGLVTLTVRILVLILLFIVQLPFVLLGALGEAIGEWARFFTDDVFRLKRGIAVLTKDDLYQQAVELLKENKKLKTLNSILTEENRELNLRD